MEYQRILLAEDDRNLGSLLREFLKVKGYQVLLTSDGESALEAFQSADFDICILDVMMPRKDGFTVAQEIRKTNVQVPILFLTARDGIADKTEGFNLGGDDYLTKPFSMEELLLRIKALLRRGRKGMADAREPEDWEIGTFKFHFPSRILSSKDGDRRLTSREADLLRLLCMNMNDILERNIALKQIWGDDSYFNARSMDVFITKLRKYLRDDENIEIMNVHGTGYKLLVS